MTFLAPGWIALAGIASLAVVAIHFIAWRLPRAMTLPTARFVPDEPARLAARTVRLADLPLLVLRVACLMAGGLAMARPALQPSPQGTAAVVAMERAARIVDVAALRDSLRTIAATDRTTFVVFDTAVRIHEDLEAALSDAGEPGVSGGASLTVGLLAAIREARRLAREHESVRIVLASTFSRGAFDRATTDVRATWRDSIRVLRLEPPARALTPVSVETRAAEGDPIVAGIRLAQAGRLLEGTSRIVRGVATAGDTAWITAGRALIVWPRAGNGEPERVDGIRAGGFTAIGHFIRMPLRDSGHVIARWMNGAAAAHETAHAGGCVRTIGLDVPDAGDFVLTPSFQRLLSALAAPCGGLQAVGILPDSVIGSIAMPPAATSTATTPDESRESGRLAAGLMALAILLALLELLLRRRLGSIALLRQAERVS